MNRVALALSYTLLAASALQQPATAAEPAVFFLDANSQPVVRLDRLPAELGAVRSLLALYSLENGAGCEGKDESGLVRCKLTAALGLGVNCSTDHINLVRQSFDSIPKLSPRWNERDASTDSPGALENLCYRQPDTASWQNVWEIIRVGTYGEIVKVDAILAWGSQYGHGRIRYEHTYKLAQGRVQVLSGKEIELSRSSKGAF